MKKTVFLGSKIQLVNREKVRVKTLKIMISKEKLII